MLEIRLNATICAANVCRTSHNPLDYVARIRKKIQFSECTAKIVMSTSVVTANGVGGGGGGGGVVVGSRTNSFPTNGKWRRSPDSQPTQKSISYTPYGTSPIHYCVAGSSNSLSIRAFLYLCKSVRVGDPRRLLRCLANFKNILMRQINTIWFEFISCCARCLGTVCLLISITRRPLPPPPPSSLLIANLQPVCPLCEIFIYKLLKINIQRRAFCNILLDIST